MGLTVAITDMMVQIDRRVNPGALYILALRMENMTVLDPGILGGRNERHFDLRSASGRAEG